MLKGLGGLGDMAKMMKAAQQMQERMAGLQMDLDKITVDGQAGAGLVRVTANAKGDLTAINIDASIFNADDKEVVEDLILAAVKDAQAKAAERASAEMNRISEELGLPKGMGMPF